MLKMLYMLVLTLMCIDAAWSMTQQNSSVVTKTVLEDIWDYQGNSRPNREVGAITGIIAAVAGIATTGISAGGAAMASSGQIVTHEHKAYYRNFEMTAGNYLKWSLLNPKSLIWYGRISQAPRPIKPCHKAFVAGHMEYLTASGTSGLVSWKIREANLTIIVHWSVPFNYACRTCCNGLGLGIYKDLPVDEPSVSHRHYYFHDLHYNHNKYPDSAGSAPNLPKTVAFRPSCYSASELCTSNGGIQICGSMTTQGAARLFLRIEHKRIPMQCAKVDSHQKPIQLKPNDY